MINYDELDRFYTGVMMPITLNMGNALLELGDDINTLFYKIDEYYYLDVNRKILAQVVNNENSTIRTGFIIKESSLTPVKNKQEIIDSSSFIKRLTFKSSNVLKKFNN